ncbi:carbamoyltransferase HypF, partial [bacterium]|nr:carbamoyltransferase HypF [bacterium]
KIFNGRPLFIRRARGYVPYPQAVPEQLKYSGQILALGGELKGTISVYKNGYVITSQFLGDLDEYQNFKDFQEAIAHLSRLFDIKADVIVSDLHPDFHTTRYAEKSGISHLRVQHHFAHILAPMLEHNIARKEKVLGIALDGFGYGSDGTAWGGEFLLTDYSGYERFAHFEYLPLPGGDLAAKQPWRMSLAYLYNIFGPNLPALDALMKVSPDKIKGVIGMIEQKLCCPQSSSCGRLFDAVSFLAGLAPIEVEFEAQAPMLLESCADSRIKHAYEFELSRSSEKDGFKGPHIV